MAFRVTRPPARVQAFDSDEEEQAPRDELLSGYSHKGSIRKGTTKIEKARPLVIPSQPNADWREIAKQRRARAGLYLPEGVQIDGRADTPRLEGGADVINANPVVGGLKLGSPAASASPSPALAAALAETSLDTPSSGGALTPAEQPAPLEAATETEDQLALRELLSGADGADVKPRAALDAISVAPDSLRTRPPTEDDAFRMDVEGRPDMATNEDYERVPIDQFGAALLRGMGWKPHESQEAFVPQRRPALLGIGAKESALQVDQSRTNMAGGKTVYKKPEPKFMPLVRKESESARSSQPPSRDRSRSPVSREQSDDDRRRRRDRAYDSDRDHHQHRRIEDSSSKRDRYSDDEESRRRRRDREDRRYDDRYSRDYDKSRRDRERDRDRDDRRNGR